MKRKSFMPRHVSNSLDSFVLVQGQHCQVKSPAFDTCPREASFAEYDRPDTQSSEVKPRQPSFIERLYKDKQKELAKPETISRISRELKSNVKSNPYILGEEGKVVMAYNIIARRENLSSYLGPKALANLQYALFTDYYLSKGHPEPVVQAWSLLNSTNKALVDQPLDDRESIGQFEQNSTGAGGKSVKSGWRPIDMQSFNSRWLGNFPTQVKERAQPLDDQESIGQFEQASTGAGKESTHSRDQKAIQAQDTMNLSIKSHDDITKSENTGSWLYEDDDAGSRKSINSDQSRGVVEPSDPSNHPQETNHQIDYGELFKDIEGKSIEAIIARIPKEATGRNLFPGRGIEARMGFVYQWQDQNENQWAVYAYLPEQKDCWTARVIRTNRDGSRFHMDSSGEFHAHAVANEPQIHDKIHIKIPAPKPYTSPIDDPKRYNREVQTYH
jgi:hypothetical protein